MVLGGIVALHDLPPQEATRRLALSARPLTHREDVVGRARRVVAALADAPAKNGVSRSRGRTTYRQRPLACITRLVRRRGAGLRDGLDDHGAVRVPAPTFLARVDVLHAGVRTGRPHRLNAFRDAWPCAVALRTTAGLRRTSSSATTVTDAPPRHATTSPDRRRRLDDARPLSSVRTESLAESGTRSDSRREVTGEFEIASSIPKEEALQAVAPARARRDPPRADHSIGGLVWSGSRIGSCGQQTRGVYDFY